jgi:hypothetical protein
MTIAAEAVDASLQVALQILQQATAADTEGATDIAVRLYSEAVVRLEQVAAVVPSEHASVLQKHATSTKQRVDVLKQEKTIGGGVVSIGAQYFPQFPFPFSAQPLPVLDERSYAPPPPILRPFWLMRLLSQSMQSGSYITPSVYLSKTVWLQDGATTVIAGIPPKVKYLSALCELLHDVQLLSPHDSSKFRHGLDTFLLEARKHFATFATEVGHKKSSSGGSGGDNGSGSSGSSGSGGGAGGGIGSSSTASTSGSVHSDPVPQRSRFSIGVRELLHRGQSVLKGWKQNQDATYSSYIAWAVNVFEQAQLFARWVQYFTDCPSKSMPEKEMSYILERLQQISTLFYVGPCRLLLFDGFLLIDRYASKSRESISRLLPVNIYLKGSNTSATAQAATAPSSGAHNRTSSSTPPTTPAPLR